MWQSNGSQSFHYEFIYINFKVFSCFCTRVICYWQFMSKEKRLKRTRLVSHMRFPHTVSISNFNSNSLFFRYFPLSCIFWKSFTVGSKSESLSSRQPICSRSQTFALKTTFSLSGCNLTTLSVAIRSDALRTSTATQRGNA